MPLALLFIGILAVVIAVKGNQNDVAKQLVTDFSGASSFVPWIVAILVIAVIGKVANVPNASKMFIGLIVIVYLFANSSTGAGLWSQITSAVTNLQAPAPSDPNATGAPTQAVVGASGATTGTSPVAGSVTAGLGGATVGVGPVSASISPAGISAGAGFGGLSLGGGFSF
jgi:hypothetical protein